MKTTFYSLLVTALLLPASLFAQHEKADSLYNRSLELISAFQFEEAVKILSTLYIKDEHHIDYLQKLGYCNFQLGRYRDAKIFYNEVLKLDSTNASALSSIGSIYERESNYQRASDYYFQLIQIDSTNSYYYKKLGYTALRLGNGTGAALFFLQAHALNPSDVEIIDQLSTLYLKADQLEFAEQILNKGLSIAPENIRLLQNKARLFSKRKDYTTVIQTIEQIFEQGDTTNYYQMMAGVSFLQLDSTEQALFHLDQLREKGEKSEHLYHYLGLARQDVGELDLAAEYLAKAIELGISPKMHLYYADLAKVWEAQNDNKKAIEYYTLALEYQEAPEYFFHLARNSDLYYADKRIAIRYYERYLASGDPKFQEYTKQRIGHLKEVVHFRH